RRPGPWPGAYPESPPPATTSPRGARAPRSTGEIMSTTWLSADALVRRRKATEGQSHRDLAVGEFWRRVPAYSEVDEATFLDHRFQAKHSVTRAEQLYAVLRECVSDAFYQ